MATVFDYGPEEKALQAYLREGEARARELGNRGPVGLTDDGKLHPDIVDAYQRVGFYVFEGVLDAAELGELETDFLDIVDRLPTSPEAPLDRHGRPALGADQDLLTTMWSKPLGDPLGGTALANGRHAVKMFEPEPTPGLPDQVPYIVLGTLQFSDAALRLAGHPLLLAAAATINGEDFVPFTEALIIKKPGEGASFSWHQDGTTHWDSPDWDGDSHGFNFMAQLYGSTAANGVWYLPGTHKAGRVDLKTIIDEAGSDRLPGAVPLISKPGDVAISNRQIVHGSFANTSPDWRVTFNLGFHRRRSVLGATGYNTFDNTPVVYGEERIRKRSELIGYAIDARRQHFAKERPFSYRPHAEAGEQFHWNAAARESIRGYQRNDLVI